MRHLKTAEDILTEVEETPMSDSAEVLPVLGNEYSCCPAVLTTRSCGEVLIDVRLHARLLEIIKLLCTVYGTTTHYGREFSIIITFDCDCNKFAYESSQPLSEQLFTNSTQILHNNNCIHFNDFSRAGKRHRMS